MRKFIALALLVGAVLALPATMSGAGDARGPACADVVDGDFIYLNGTTVILDASLAASPCTFGGGRVSYTLDIYSGNSATEPGTLLASTSSYTQPETLPATTIRLEKPVAETDGVVCIVLTTSIGGHVIDRAPDSGCRVVTAATPGFGGFN